MWTEIRQEIERVRQELGLTSEQFRPVGADEWLSIQGKVEEAFRQPAPPAKRNQLLWTQLRTDLPVAVLADVGSHETALPRLPAPWRDEEPVFFFVQESVQDTKMWWFRTSGAVAWQLLGHLWQKPGPLQEWGIVDRKYRWALFVNHVDDIIFCGDPLVSQVRQLGAQAGVWIR